MKLNHTKNSVRNRTAFTLIELLVASSIGVLVAGSLAFVMLEVAKEHRRGVADTVLLTKANQLQDRITGTLRKMSATESVIFGEPLGTGIPFYRRIIVAEGAAPTYPRQEIFFTTNNLSITLKPNRNVSGGDIVLFVSETNVKLANCYFFPSLKPGGIPDSSAINVYFEFDDNYAAGYRTAAGNPKKSKVVRTFTVKLRNQ